MEKRGESILLRGPRRVGKTTIMHQVCSDLLAGGCEPEEVLYVPLDDPGLDPDSVFDDMLKAHPGRKPYLFIDEVSYHGEWSRWVKRLVDLRSTSGLLLSSSASMLLRKGVTESLVGRVIEREVYPFSASERSVLIGDGNRFDPETATALRSVWKEFFDDPRTESLFEGLAGISDRISLKGGIGEEIGYLTEGGFPEYISERDKAVRGAYFHSNVVDRVLFIDLPQVFRDIGNPAALRDLFLLVASRGSALFVSQNAASDLGLSRQTVSKYLAYLGSAGLIRVLEKWAASATSRVRAPRKVVAADGGLFASMAGIGKREAKRAAGEALGKMAEIAVLCELYRKGAGDLYYWRDRSREVDFVVARGQDSSGRRSVVAVEVKFRGKARAGKYPGLDAFRRRFGDSVRSELVVNPNVLELQGSRLFVPIGLFLE